MKNYSFAFCSLFFTAILLAPNPHLQTQVVTNFPLTYQQLIDYVNATETKPNNLIHQDTLPHNLLDMRKRLFDVIHEKKQLDFACLEIILSEQFTTESERFKHDVLRPTLLSITDELLILEEAGIITPLPSFRTPRMDVHNPEDLSPELSRRHSSTTSATSSLDERFDSESNFSDTYLLDDDTLSTVSSRAMTPEFKKTGELPTPETLRSSQSWGNFF